MLRDRFNNEWSVAIMVKVKGSLPQLLSKIAITTGILFYCCQFQCFVNWMFHSLEVQQVKLFPIASSSFK